MEGHRNWRGRRLKRLVLHTVYKRMHTGYKMVNQMVYKRVHTVYKRVYERVHTLQYERVHTVCKTVPLVYQLVAHTV